MRVGHRCSFFGLFCCIGSSLGRSFRLLLRPVFRSVAGFARRRRVLHHVRHQFGGNMIRCGLVRRNSGVLVNLSKKGSSLTLVRLLKEQTHVFGPHFSIMTIRIIVGGVPCRDGLRCLQTRTRAFKMPLIMCRASFSPSASAHGSPYFLYS